MNDDIQEAPSIPEYPENSTDIAPEQVRLSPLEPGILTQGLTRKFGGLVAVDHLDLVVPKGSFFGFLGPNGAGKSTTISMLTGLLTPSSGEAKILGYDLRKDLDRIKQKIGVVPEQLSLFERLTGQEYLMFVGRLYGVPGSELLSRTRQLLEFMQLTDSAKKLIIEYSRGMKKKIALSAALIHRPQVLFLDEPFEGIDALSTRAIREVLQKLVKQGITLFLTSHVLEVVERLCDRIAIIHQGKLIASGSMDELNAGIELVSPAGEKPKRNLEEIFLSLLGQTEQVRPDLSWLTELEGFRPKGEKPCP